ncbi:uncharacterized protein LOC114523177 [Dendronephthya gigantea]|uniref:uncharacterized protein LOC114523177 n=1 Tax=Dendronephthya gigantea TaxID=151771 RepID=UPI00106BBE83|nr:uncharacterized protein LOC114523177 [Dendronephthya gigantea]
MNFEEKEAGFSYTEKLGFDEDLSTDRLTQSWNGFTNTDSRNSHELQARSFDKKSNAFSKNSMRNQHSKSFEAAERKLLKMPKTFPGVKITEVAEKSEEPQPPPEKVETESRYEAKMTLDDIEKVLNSGRGRNSGVKSRREEKLPRLKVTKAKPEVSNEGKSGNINPQGASHAFNCARMLTELNEVCSLKTTGVAGDQKSDENLLPLRRVHEARRNSAFTPRERPHHHRCRSLPNLSTHELPKRFFVKLDPLRASATPVNLSSWNETSRRCRVLSENFDKLDQLGIEPSEKERKALIGQWIRETSQLDFRDSHVTTEVEI